MVKNRLHIPKVTRDSVLAEFNHRCAICGADKPQVHHIDENPSNNDPTNLIPLCPNCHLVDQHNPTRLIEPEKLKLFRKHKDPTILKPQFHPLLNRIRFLDSIDDDADARELASMATELADFVAALEMGSFYSKQIVELLERPNYFRMWTGEPGETETHRAEDAQRAKEYREKLRRSRAQVYSLVIELLRFQKW
jgi:hypothetical protein